MGEQKRFTVVIADDDRRYALELERQVAAWGFDARAVFSGAEALEIARTAAPDVIVADSRMPGVSGLDLLEEIRDDPETCLICVILMTEDATDEEVIRGFRSCSTCHLSKPVPIDELRSFLARLVANPVEDDPEERAKCVDHMQRYFSRRAQAQVNVTEDNTRSE
jgi:CheY-like chemotaxis protein